MPNAPLKTLQSMTRNNFDPGIVLVALRDGIIPSEDLTRLLEEGCHAHKRLRHEHQSTVLRVRAALPAE